MTSVVTTFSPKGYEVYGKRMIASFLENWPSDIKLYVFHEGEKPKDADPGVHWVSLDSDKDRAAFLATDLVDSLTDYRFRPKRYSHKVFAMTAAPRDGHLIWVDADTETKNKISPEILDKLLPPPGKIASYLARPYYRHTETGFLAFSPEAGPFLDEMRRIYTSGELVKLPEWHDCAVFDHVRVRFEREGHRFHNLCPNAVGLQVFEQSPLAYVISHYKGPARKLRQYGEAMS